MPRSWPGSSRSSPTPFRAGSPASCELRLAVRPVSRRLLAQADCAKVSIIAADPRYPLHVCCRWWYFVAWPPGVVPRRIRQVRRGRALLRQPQNGVTPPRLSRLSSIQHGLYLYRAGPGAPVAGLLNSPNRQPVARFAQAWPPTWHQVHCWKPRLSPPALAERQQLAPDRIDIPRFACALAALDSAPQPAKPIRPRSAPAELQEVLTRSNGEWYGLLGAHASIGGSPPDYGAHVETAVRRGQLIWARAWIARADLPDRYFTRTTTGPSIRSGWMGVKGTATNVA